MKFVKAYPSEAPFRPLGLAENFILGWKGSQGTNIVPYYEKTQITALKVL
jgi:hypothetical protein